MKDNLLLALVLQVLGIGVIMVEIVLPSAGLLAITATCLIGYSLYTVFTTMSISTGIIFIAADVIIIPIAVVAGFKLLARSPVTLRKQLSRDDGVTAQTQAQAPPVGTEGKAVTPLRPAGMALIQGKRIDVVSRGDYIEKESPIIVFAVTGNQVIVVKKETQ